MRETRFRIYSPRQKEMVHFNLKEVLSGEIAILAKETCVIMQYTGLKDKNGKEIYEGDIFNFCPSKEWRGTEPDNPCVVFWSDELCAFMFYVGKPEMSTLLPPSESIEVIGNIYEDAAILSIEVDREAR